MKFAAPASVIAASDQLLVNGGSLLVMVEGGPHASRTAGIVFAATMLVRVPVYVFQGLAASLLPNLTHLNVVADARRFRRAVAQATGTLLLVGAAIVAAAALFGPQSMGLLYGSGFDAGRSELVLLGAGVGFYLAASTLSQALLALDAGGRAAICWTIAAVLFVGLYWAVPGEALMRIAVAFAVATAREPRAPCDGHALAPAHVGAPSSGALGTVGRGVDAGTLAWMIGAGAATALGGLALLAFPHPSDRLMDGLLGFTAGVMLAATAFSLLVPALERGNLGEVLAGFLFGGLAFALLDLVVPHVHARFAEKGAPTNAAGERAILLLSALTIHNVPEGLAVGVAFAAGGDELGVPLALAIGIQNVPEGFAAAAPLLGAGVSRRRAIGFAAATGAVEPPAAIAAFAAFGLASVLLPLGLAFAAGAMLYVIVDELVPESHARGNQRLATLTLMAGFALMLALDNAFA